MKIRVKKGRKSITVEVKKLSPFEWFFGLMFRTRSAKNMLFDFPYNSRHVIHSYFVFFDFLAVWLDEENNVVDAFKVSPFTFSARPKKKCKKLLEVPFNDDNDETIRFFVGKGNIYI